VRRGRDEDEEDGAEGQGREVGDAAGGVVASGQERRGGGGVGEERFHRQRRRRGERACYIETGRACAFPKGATRHTITSSKQVGVGSFCHVCVDYSISAHLRRLALPVQSTTAPRWTRATMT